MVQHFADVLTNFLASLAIVANSSNYTRPVPPPDSCKEYHEGQGLQPISPRYEFTVLDKSSIDRDNFAWWELSKNYPWADFKTALPDNHFEVKMENGEKWTIQSKKFGPNPVRNAKYIVTLYNSSVNPAEKIVRSFFIWNLDTCNFYAVNRDDYSTVVTVKIYRYA